MENSEINCSKTLIKFYDRERHILINDAYKIVESQKGLSLNKLEQAVEKRYIHVYEFNNERYLDRIDIGRIYHIKPENKSGIKIERYFTKKGDNPLGSVEYEDKDLKILDIKGNAIFEMQAEFPVSWDENSSKIVAQKYFFSPYKQEWKDLLEKKLGIPYEKSIRHLITRISNFFADNGYKRGYFTSEEDKDAFRDELEWLQINRRGAFNSPVQFNAGIYNEYGIKGSPGINYYRDPESGEVKRIEEGEYIMPQCHACFIKGPQDDLESIAMHTVHEIGIFSLGSGIGQNIGSLRAEGEKLSGGGMASGPLSYLNFYDNVAGSIKSGGKSRRAARMTTMRQNHPDIIKFIESKVKEDKKALALIKAGYSPGMDGEAYATVSFQNTNFSVRLDNYFFGQLENKGNIDLYNIKDGKKAGEVSVEEIMKKIAFGSWRIGDPGVQYEGEIDKMHTCPNSGRQNSTNPCGEYMFLDDTSCNLASLNLLEFSDDKGYFNIESFKRAVKIFAIAQDIANDSASYPVRDIAELSPEFRTIGLGFANLSGLFMRNGLRYDSDEARALAGAITAVMTGAAYETSTELAEKLGTFMHFNLNKAPMLKVIDNHKKALEDILWKYLPENFKKEAYNLWERVIKKGEVYGFRNAQATVIAPTGTISYLMGAQDSTGIEPPLSLVINKDLTGGGSIQIINSRVPNALENLGYNEEEIKDIVKYIEEHNKVIGAPHLIPKEYDIFATAWGNNYGEGSIPLEGHIKMMGAVQPFVSGGISKTNNLPQTATVKDVYNSFLLGHKLGLKGLTFFRTNSKPVSAFNFGKEKLEELKRGEKEDLSLGRNAFEVEVKINDTPLHMIISEYDDGRPGQIAFLCYKAGSTLKALLETQGILASKSLKRGVNLEAVIESWIDQAFEPRGLIYGHHYIKTANSPLDFAGKFLRLEYLGDVEVADNKENVDIKQLRGYNNGAFETYRKMSIDDWDIEQVLKDQFLGGFVEKSKMDQLKDINGKKGLKENNNNRGVTCTHCGNIMIQTSPNCYNCDHCGSKRGGCGL